MPEFTVLPKQDWRCPGCGRSWVLDAESPVGGEVARFGWETLHKRADGFYLCCGNRFRFLEKEPTA